MSLVHHVTCGDLALLGGRWDALARHDPRQMDPQLDTLCHCYPRAPLRTRDAQCRDLLRIPVGQDHVLVLCCLCASRFRDAQRGVRDRALYPWLLAQVEAALHEKDQRRWDSSPVASDIDGLAGLAEVGR